MKIVGIIVVLCVAIVVWRITTFVSPDAVAMAVGMLFGVLAGIPTALLMQAGNRDGECHDRQWTDEELAAHGIQRQPPVVIIYSNHTTNNTVIFEPSELRQFAESLGLDDAEYKYDGQWIIVDPVSQERYLPPPKLAPPPGPK